jgi:hypothetical protein
VLKQGKKERGAPTKKKEKKKSEKRIQKCLHLAQLMG